MRLVRITIEYDMDDTEKTLHDELQSWINDDINIHDVIRPKFSAMEYQWATPTTLVDYHDVMSTARINELDSQGEVK